MEDDALVELLEKGRDDLPRGPAEVGGLGTDGVGAGKGDLLVEGHGGGREETGIVSVAVRRMRQEEKRLRRDSHRRRESTPATAKYDTTLRWQRLSVLPHSPRLARAVHSVP